MPPYALQVFVWDSTNFDAINQWHKLSGSVLILSYSKFKNLHRSKAKAGIDMVSSGCLC